MLERFTSIIAFYSYCDTYVCRGDVNKYIELSYLITLSSWIMCTVIIDNYFILFSEIFNFTPVQAFTSLCSCKLIFSIYLMHHIKLLYDTV